MNADKNTPGPWTVRVRRMRDEPHAIVDCFVQAPDVHGYAYDAEVLGDDEYTADVGGSMQRKLADCQLIAAAIAMRNALRKICKTTDPARMWQLAEDALAELDKAPT